MRLDRSKRPLSSTEVEFIIPQVIENKLSNGLK